MISVTQRKPSHVPPNQHLSLSAKINEGHWCEECIVCTVVCQATSKSEKIKHLIAVVELGLSEGISQLLSHLFSQSAKNL